MLFEVKSLTSLEESSKEIIEESKRIMEHILNSQNDKKAKKKNAKYNTKKKAKKALSGTKLNAHND